MGVQSCCCFSLKTGTTIIASLYIICTIIEFVGLFVGPSYKSQNGKFTSLGMVLMISYIMNLILSVMLLMGSIKEKANFILPALWWFAIYFPIVIVIICVDPPSEIAKMRLGWILPGCLICLGIGIYLWLVIYSFYQKLNKLDLKLIVYDKNISRGPSNLNVLI